MCYGHVWIKSSIHDKYNGGGDRGATVNLSASSPVQYQISTMLNAHTFTNYQTKAENQPYAKLSNHINNKGSAVGIDEIHMVHGLFYTKASFCFLLCANLWGLVLQLSCKWSP